MFQARSRKSKDGKERSEGLVEQVFPKKNFGDDNFILDSNVTIRFKCENLRSRDRRTYL